jgi:hypothetical protein
MKWHTSWKSAFASPDCQRPAVQIKVTKLEITRFLAANAGIHQDCQHCLVALAAEDVLLSMRHAEQHIDRLIRQS